ncbi:hypothetical protein RF11_10205 [Thelohanellus kitauei]|uniref:Uncharacterized protein n=1 Tax=Thelohanellus kitauei TaxID=669202 RepID=A0A0C2JJR0_THEKT|nr:hypothetical protein RF11_10205 [Thelohanellus kitauei]
MIHRYQQINRYMIDPTYNLLCLVIGLVSLFMVNAALVFPVLICDDQHNEMPKTHLYFSVSFFCCATIYFMINAVFSVQLCKYKGVNNYKYVAATRFILMVIILFVCLIHLIGK